jgi:hypothetical protein
LLSDFSEYALEILAGLLSADFACHIDEALGLLGIVGLWLGLAWHRSEKMILPDSLDLMSLHDRAVNVARSLNGLRVADAIEILENAKGYVLKAGIAATDLIPARNGEPQISP